MREIKFRIWDDKNARMIYLEREQVSMEYFLEANRDGRLMVNTGMRDVYDVEIYEGDFIDLYNTYKEEYFKGKVKYIESAAEFVLESEQLTRHKRWINYDMKVVGNSFEHSRYAIEEE